MRIATASSLVGLSVLGMCLAQSPAATAAATDNQPVLIRMQVPAGAQVWFNGAPTTQTGAVREFVSPPVASGKNYSYEVRVRWMADGKAVEQERKLSVRAGQQVNVEVNAQNMSVSRSLYYPPAGNETARAPSANYYTAPSWYYGDYSSGYSDRSSGLSKLDWMPYDPADYVRWNTVGNE